MPVIDGGTGRFAFECVRDDLLWSQRQVGSVPTIGVMLVRPNLDDQWRSHVAGQSVTRDRSRSRRVGETRARRNVIRDDVCQRGGQVPSIARGKTYFSNCPSL